MRTDGRGPEDLRAIRFDLGYNRYAEGSVLISFGETVVLCNASVEESVPPFMRGEGRGWVTAEYAMLPRATQSRSPREVNRGRPGGRTLEIQRLIGRSLRAIVDLNALGERSIVVDCDVLQADGGTRTASITGACLALRCALDTLLDKQLLKSDPMKEWVAAVSVGIVGDNALLDLDYSEDSSASVDMNFVVTESGRFVEIQGTAEEEPFSEDQFEILKKIALGGCATLVQLQKLALEKR
ncbi:MAG: ribonuclease PH [Deltaproteobacteria bacterium]|nr:ribonuclease PH [Deltaproteobacteria bacterium]